MVLLGGDSSTSSPPLRPPDQVECRGPMERSVPGIRETFWAIAPLPLSLPLNILSVVMLWNYCFKVASHCTKKVNPCYTPARQSRQYTLRLSPERMPLHYSSTIQPPEVRKSSSVLTWNLYASYTVKLVMAMNTNYKKTLRLQTRKKIRPPKQTALGGPPLRPGLHMSWAEWQEKSPQKDSYSFLCDKRFPSSLWIAQMWTTTIGSDDSRFCTEAWFGGRSGH